MALLTELEVIQRSARATPPREGETPLDTQFDIFLSHSSEEPEPILLGVKLLLEDQGLTVYVSRYVDPRLSVGEVTRDIAELTRIRLRASSALLYVHSGHATSSLWMPWELGFFDGHKGRVGIVRVLGTGLPVGKAFLALYPYVEISPIFNTKKNWLWIHASRNEYALLAPWARGDLEIEARPQR